MPCLLNAVLTGLCEPKEDGDVANRSSSVASLVMGALHATPLQVVASVVLLCACAGQTRMPAVPPALLCSPDGYCVPAQFAPFYEKHAALMGLPISGPLEYRERLVQYFPAGRLEYVPENPPGWEVGLAYLAQEVCGRQPPLNYSDVPSYLDRGARYYSETGHSLRGDFLRFVQANGGTDFFGPPISEERRIGEEVAQDFVRVQLRRRGNGGFYLADLGALVMAGAAPAPGLCPSVPADDPDAETGQADGGQDD